MKEKFAKTIAFELLLHCSRKESLWLLFCERRPGERGATIGESGIHMK